MAHWPLKLSLVCLLVIASGGCPQTAGNAVPAAFPLLGGGASTTPVVEDTSDALRERFPTCQIALNEGTWRAEILLLVNQERTRRGLGRVVRNAVLETQATQYACELIHYGFFDHVNPTTGTTLSDRAVEFGYEFRVIGENLAAGQRSPSSAMADWMGSPGHAANILNPEFTELGIGVRLGGEFGVYWVQEFGRPASERGAVLGGRP